MRRGPTGPASRCSTTAPSTWRATPPTSRRCATPSNTPAASPCRVYCASLRTAEPELLELLGTADALVTTVLAAGGAVPATVGAGGTDDPWNVAHLAALDIPILQGLCLTSSRAQWTRNDDGMSPLDVATQVAVPEFDGRIITVPFSFKEIDDEGLISYVADPERCARVAGLAVRHARLRHVAPADKRVALVFSAYPTKHARIGNAVGLDTPASAVALLRAMRDAGYDIGDVPGVDAGDGDALIHALIERGGQDPDWLTEGQLAGNPIRVSAKDYRAWFATLPARADRRHRRALGSAARRAVRRPQPRPRRRDRHRGNAIRQHRARGPAAARLRREPGRDLPRSRPAAEPPLPGRLPLAGQVGFGADAVVHLGKHGNLEWLPGKTLGMSATCGTDAALGDLPLIYPFLVNDPGEGTQAKRRAHAVLVDHLIPPMARAESYGDIARLEQLLDEHSNIAALDPGKLPAIRQQIWTLMRAAKMDHDLGLEDRPDEDVVRRHAAARRRLAVRDQGRPDPRRAAHPRSGARRRGRTRPGAGDPAGPPAVRRRADGARVCGRRSAWPRTAPTTASAVDAAEARARELVAALQEAGLGRGRRRSASPTTPRSPRCCASPPPRWCRGCGAPTAEIDQILHALDGGFIAAGPSGSPLRGLVNVLPTGRNFYSVDPKAVPSRLAWETGVGAGGFAARALPRRPRRVAAVGRTVGVGHLGDAHLGRRHRRSACAARCSAGVGRRVAARRRPRSRSSLAELGRPRIDVTVRISGFFRDAFPHVVDDARRRGRSWSPGSTSPTSTTTCARTPQADLAEHGDQRRATTRIFGSKPGTYGAGLLQLIDSRNWRDDADLARGLHRVGWVRLRPRPRRCPGRRRHEPAYRRIAVAAKNTDTREHDIADSDDYFQYHGGMIATVRALTGTRPGGLHRRQHPARRRAHPHAVGGDHAGLPGPRGQPALDHRDAQARLQGRLRDGRHRRLPVRLRRHRRA